MNLKMRNSLASHRNFTLVELLTVIGIIAILSGLLVGGLHRARQSSRRAACQSNLHQLGLGVQMYLDSNSEVFPVACGLPSMAQSLGEPEKRISVELLSYVGNNGELFKCPADVLGENGTYFDREGSSYEYNERLSGEKRYSSSVTDYGESVVPVLFDYDCFHAVLPQPKVKNYLFVDGHVGDLE